MSTLSSVEAASFHMGVLPVTAEVRPVGEVVTECTVDIHGTCCHVRWQDLQKDVKILDCWFSAGGWDSPISVRDEQQARRQLAEVARQLPHFHRFSRDRVVAALRAVSANQA